MNTFGKDTRMLSGWNESTLGELCSIVTGKLDVNQANSDGKYPFFTCAKETYSINRYAFDDEAVLVAGNGFFNVKYYKGKFNAYQRTYVLHEINVNAKYLYYLVEHRLENITSGKRGSTIQYIRLGDLRDHHVWIAPPEQQKRIVAKIEELFSHIDAGIKALKKAKQLLKQYRQSVLKAAVTGELTKEWREANKDRLEPASQLLERILKERLRKWEEQQLEKFKAKGKVPKDDKWREKYREPIISDTERIHDLPEGWTWARLDNLTVDIFDGPFGSNLKSSDYVEEGVRVIRLENIGNLEFKDKNQSYVTVEKYELLKKHTVVGGDIIFSSFVVDETRVVVLPSQIKKAINKADCFCIRCYGSSLNNSYLSLFLATDMVYKRLENEVHGATRPRINTTQFKTIAIPICSYDEQDEIVRILNLKFDSVQKIETDIEESLLVAGKSKQSILASAFKCRFQ